MGATVKPSQHEAAEFRGILNNAIGYWERRRIVYNSLLTATVLIWIAATWPHFRSAFAWQPFVALAALAVFANLCYCAAYIADLAMQYSSFREYWRRWRWALWTVGMLFALLLANYWIADEIYSYVPNVH